MTRILLVGCGKMGGALLAGWIEQGTDPRDIVVIEPAAPVAPLPGLRVVKAAADVPAGFQPEMVVLAVKPQMMDQVLPSVAGHIGSVYLSIAAGRTIASLTKGLGGKASVVRAMPNTPAAIGRGISVAVAGPGVTEAQRKACDASLSAAGAVEWVEDEGLIDAVTAVSGSGPAYVFLLAEAVTEAGIAVGLPPQLAEKLARATISGAGELLHRSTEPASALREAVTSPKGTTFAALEVLRAEPGLMGLMKRAVAAAWTRSKELAG